MERHIYDDILDDFELYYPEIVKDAVTWYPSGRREITVKLRDGGRVIFDGGSKTFRRISNYDAPMMEEDNWKTGFGRKLGQALCNRCISQSTLSERTGISQTMISRYISGNSIPSAYIIAKLARALECSLNELMDFE